MDSLTQIVLGASVAEACLGRRVGGRAALAGAVLGTLPDLDSFIPYASDVATFTYHRSFSHSLLVLTALAPLFGWLTRKALGLPRDCFRACWLLAWLVLVTHPLLDAFTVYGTQLFWPLSDHPVSGASVFIIDPAYTLPLALCLLLALRLRRAARARLWLNAGGLALSCLYLGWTVVARAWVEARARDELSARGIVPEGLLATPAPLTSLAWRVLAMTPEGYYEGFLTLGSSCPLHFRFQADRRDLLPQLEGHWPVERLAMFTHGFFSLQLQDDRVVMSDLRMGMEPDYVFRFEVAAAGDGGLAPLPDRALPGGDAGSQLRRLGELLRADCGPQDDR